jgi:hypothetical protein
MKNIQKWFGKWILLSLLWFVLNSIDFSQLQLNDMQQSALMGRALMSMLDSLILCWVLAKSGKHGIRLAVVIFLAVFGMKIILTVIEATYLPDLQPLVLPLLLNGAIASLLWSLTAVALTVGFTENPISTELQEKPEWSQKWYQWILKPILLAIIWMVLFVFFGAVVFMNIARLIDPQALASYTNLVMPDWVLPFQGLRALLWLALALPLLMQLYGKYNRVLFLSGSVFAVWMGSNLFMALDLPAGLRYAHLAEVMTECFVFGVLVFLIFARKSHRAKIYST